MSNKSIEVPELNIKVIVIGLMLSVVMGSANVYPVSYTHLRAHET